MKSKITTGVNRIKNDQIVEGSFDLEFNIGVDLRKCNDPEAAFDAIRKLLTKEKAMIELALQRSVKKELFKHERKYTIKAKKVNYHIEEISGKVATVNLRFIDKKGNVIDFEKFHFMGGDELELSGDIKMKIKQ